MDQEVADRYLVLEIKIPLRFPVFSALILFKENQFSYLFLLTCLKVHQLDPQVLHISLLLHQIFPYLQAQHQFKYIV